jgi:hypothetical protein
MAEDFFFRTLFNDNFSIVTMYVVALAGWWMMNQKLEGSGRRLNEVLSQHLPGATQKDHEKFKVGHPMSWPILEPWTYRTQV